jgi:hypothetical protein
MFVPTFGVKNVIVISILGMKLPGKLQSPWILSSYMKEKNELKIKLKMHCLILLRIWHKISEVIGYRHVYSNSHVG